MKTALTVLLVLILAAEGILMYRMRRLINGWGKEVEDHDVALTDEEQRWVERWGKRMSLLSAAAIVLFLLRFVVFDLFPLIGG